MSGERLVTIRISDQGMSRRHACTIPLTAVCAGGGLLLPQIKSPSDLFSFSHVRNAKRLDDSVLGALRTVSSSSKGMRATVDEQLHAAAHSAPEDAPDRSAPHPRIGIGLPMSNIFAT